MATSRLRPSAFVVDTVLAAFFVIVAQVELHTTVDDGYQAGPMWLNVPLAFLMAAPVAVRRIAPTTAFSVALGAACLPGPFLAHSIFFWGSMVPIAICTYSLARHRDTLAAKQAWLAGPLLLLTNMPHVAELRTPSNIFFGLGTFALPWLVGRVLHRLANREAQLSAALARLAEEQALRERAAVDSERSRIAGEMHDVVAHAVSVMVVQVGAARMKLAQRDVTPPPELRVAEDTGRQALAELRRTLGLLRQLSDDVAMEPLPGLDALPDLVERCRAAGLDIEVDCADVRPLPTSVELATYRVVQEALTNILKHAGRVAARVTVGRREGAIRIVVENDRATGALPAVPGGHGLAGMRERVALFGGSLETGELPGGGYRVIALLPVLDDAAALP